MKKLLSENICPACSYCQFGTRFIGQEKVLCVKFGIVDYSYYCRKFKYDPLKRVPKSRKNLHNFDKNDFLI